MRNLIIALALVAACGKTDTKADHAKPGAAENVALTPKPAGGGTTWFALASLGLEVEAPGCAEVIDTGDPKMVGVGPKDPSCVMPFPGATFSKTTADIEPASLDEEVKAALADTDKPEILRKETLPLGWAIQWKKPPTAPFGGIGMKAHFAIDGTVVICVGAPVKDADQVKADVIWKACTSARKKKA